MYLIILLSDRTNTPSTWWKSSESANVLRKGFKIIEQHWVPQILHLKKKWLDFTSTYCVTYWANISLCENTRLPSNVEIVFKIKVLQKSDAFVTQWHLQGTIQKEDTDSLIVVKYRGDQSTSFMFTVHQRLMNINQPSFSNSGQHRVRSIGFAPGSDFPSSDFPNNPSCLHCVYVLCTWH